MEMMDGVFAEWANVGLAWCGWHWMDNRLEGFVTWLARRNMYVFGTFFVKFKYHKWLKK